MATLPYGPLMTGGYKFILLVFLSFWITQSKAQDYDFLINWHGEEALSLLIKEIELSEVNVRLSGKHQKIAGTITANEGTLFTPYFPFANNVTYQVFNDEQLLFSFTPQKDIKSPEVKNVFPVTDELPVNFLKFYIEFDQSMAGGHVYDYLQLIKNGAEVENAFIPLKPELWDANKQIVTVWIDPGRIKRDLGPNKKYGAVLEAGYSYQLIIGKGLKATNGADLNAKFVKSFHVFERDEKTPSVTSWTLNSPTNNSREMLLIDMQEVMDYSSHHFMSVFYNGNEMEGDFEFISDGEISFFPKKSWQKGEYVLKIASKAEDLAGNNFNRPFDRDLNKLPNVSEQKFYEIKFNIL